jgi:hypothetical protein
MRFLDNLSKSLSSGVERAKFEADKFQRTSKISGEISNFRSQIDTNMRQLGERALELYQQGTLQAPEIASLAQIIAQLREQQAEREQELDRLNSETFEQFQASQPRESAPETGQNVPIGVEPAEGGFPTPTSSGSQAVPPPSTDLSGTGLPNSSSVTGVDVTEGDLPPLPVGDVEAKGATPYACANCGYAIPEGAVFCPNCGTRVAGR